MTPLPKKLGTRLLLGAMVAAAVGAATGSVVTRASSAARVTTLAGTGTLTLAGDGGPANQASLARPAGVAANAAGDAIIADTGNCRIREVPTSDTSSFGITMRARNIYTIAGSSCGTSSDPGPAVRAHLSFPTAVALDTTGNVLVADTGNNRIRRIAIRTGRISVVAGTGVPGFSGDRGAATAAALNEPSGITVDSRGNVLVADTNNCRVREIAAVTATNFGIAMTPGNIYTVAGTGRCGNGGDGAPAVSARLSIPTGVALDPHGNLLVADTGNRIVREVAGSAGTNFGVAMTAGNIYTVAGSGSYNPYFGDGLPAASEASSLSFPNGIAVDSLGNLFVADTYGRAVREIPVTSGTSFAIATQAGGMYTVAGAGPAESATAGGTRTERLVYPAGLALDASGDLFVADIGNNTVEMLSGPPG